MSWDQYITYLKSLNTDGSAPIEKSAICGFDPPSIWAQEQLEMQIEEINKLNSKDHSIFASNGVKLGGIKFMLVKNDLGEGDFPCLQLRSSSISATVGKTNKAFIIGIGKKDAPAGQVSLSVYKTVKYLISQGY